MKRQVKKTIATAAWTLSALCVSCADGSPLAVIMPEKPTDVADRDYLNTYGVLKSYVNKEAGSPFVLATAVNHADFQSEGLAYSTALSNFDGIDLDGDCSPSTLIDGNGEYGFNAMKAAVYAAQNAGTAVFGGTLCSTQGQAAAHLRQLIAPIIIPSDPKTLVTMVADFEADEQGGHYAMTNGNQGVVEKDPTGKSGNVLHVGTADNFCKYSYPKFHVRLKPGKTLADYGSIALDMFLIDGRGQWGSGMRVVINGTEMNCGKGPSAFGCMPNAWAREAINIPIISVAEGSTGDGRIAITDDLAKLSEFDLAIGSGSGEWHAYIDNVRLNMKDKGDEVIEKTPEEKRAILTDEMGKWIKGMVASGGDYVKQWNVVGDLFDNTADANTFAWADYLGADGYARTAVRLAREASKADLTLFVSGHLSQYDDMVDATNRLIATADSWQSDGSTRIDGFNIGLQAVCAEDAGEQQANKEQITGMLERLAATGKPVRLSALDVIYEDRTGNIVAASDIAPVQRERAADYLSFIISEYMRIIPATLQYGISLAGMTEEATGNHLRPWTSGFERTAIYEGLANGLRQSAAGYDKTQH